MDEFHKMMMELKVELVEIRKDLNYHIKRTDDLQVLAEEFKRYKWIVLGAITVLAPFANKLVELLLK